ncbi:hypothetical protein BD324DRAFT_654461 [Kockovaella imperatae]|uniref:Uncharacterized protein n=1 Tax=Kockovaella imperatae TaxID=4999 RepID=A0A1Y1URL6_9TREE|nr:hypothetical protein BD324DRAFT_654461 [Kockovaella imperatae]ORX40698.1 hypothetical protein BD324DRAFT_654461 [Kockovaella imperatae]
MAATADEQTLASLSAVDSSTFDLDPSLNSTDTDLFLSQLKNDGDETNDHGIDDATVTAIKQSLSEAQAHADRQAQEIDGKSGSSQSGQLGSEGNPIINPTVHLAPFSKPERAEGALCPEHYKFPSKAEFDIWLAGESSWCHYVQRRTTTPQQRADERMRARVKAHERALQALTPEEAANAPPLKTRKRTNNTSVYMKITYTCHHAGNYNARHSDVLPEKRLRLKTKQSVKCKCRSRIIFTELHSGECQAVYHWKHDGHELFSDAEHQSGRLPSVIDDWLVKQIEAGKEIDEIRRVLSIPETEKQAYVQKVTEDPTLVDPDMPPPLAFQTKVKYPDIYNRFRKLRGPVRAARSPNSKRSSKRRILSPAAEQTPGYGAGPGSAADLDDSVHQTFNIDGVPAGFDLSGLAGTHHADLAEALLRIPAVSGDVNGVIGGPNGSGDAGNDDDHQQLDEQVLKIARMAAEQGERGGEAVSDEEEEEVEEVEDDHGDAEARDEIASVDWNAFAV